MRGCVGVGDLSSSAWAGCSAWMESSREPCPLCAEQPLEGNEDRLSTCVRWTVTVRHCSWESWERSSGDAHHTRHLLIAGQGRTRCLSQLLLSRLCRVRCFALLCSRLQCGDGAVCLCMSAWRGRKAGSAQAASKKKCTCLEEGTEGVCLFVHREVSTVSLCSCSHRQ